MTSFAGLRPGLKPLISSDLEENSESSLSWCWSQNWCAAQFYQWDIVFTVRCETIDRFLEK